MSTGASPFLSSAHGHLERTRELLTREPTLAVHRAFHRTTDRKERGWVVEYTYDILLSFVRRTPGQKKRETLLGWTYDPSVLKAAIQHVRTLLDAQKELP